MPAEKFANNFETTLAAGASASDVSIDVSTAAPVDLRDGQFRIRVGDEIMLVTATAAAGASPWTVTRGVEGTSAAIHASGATVTHVLTRHALLNSGVGRTQFIPFTFSSGWQVVHYPEQFGPPLGGTPYHTDPLDYAGYYREGSRVWLAGLFDKAPGTVGNSRITTIPVGFRPSRRDAWSDIGPVAWVDRALQFATPEQDSFDYTPLSVGDQGELSFVAGGPLPPTASRCLVTVTGVSWYTEDEMP